MSKFTVGLMAALLLSAGPLFATGEAEAGGADMAPGAVLPWTGAEVVYDGFVADLGIQEDPEAPVVQAYRETTGNVRIEWNTVPWNDYDTKLNLYLQSGDMPDIVWARGSLTKAVTYGPVGIFLDWDKYKEHMPNMQRWAAEFPHVNNVLTDKGERFAINDIANAEYIGEGYFYNANILAQAGIDGPPETMAEWLAQMKQIKAELPDVDAFLTQWGLGYFLHAFARPMDVKIRGVEYDQNTGQWVYGPLQPNYRKLIEFVREAYAAGAFNVDTIDESITSDRVAELQEEGNYAFTYIYYGQTTGIWDYEAGKRPPAGFQGMKPPSFEGNTYYWITVPYDSVPSWGFMASAKVKNPELLAAYIDNVMSEKTSELWNWGIEGLTFRRTADGGYETLPEFENNTAGLRELGVFNFHDARYIHYDDRAFNWFARTKKDDVGRAAMAEDIKRLQAGEMIPRLRWSRPLMTGEQNDEISKIMTPVNTFVEEERIKFITGDRDMSEWDDFVAKVNKLGDIDKVLSYYNGGKQFPMGDRRYPALPADLR